MKLVKIIATAIACISLSASTIMAQVGPPKQLPLTTALLDAYALSKVSQISGSMYAPSVSKGDGNYQTIAYSPDGDPKHMAAVASTIHLHFGVDPLEEINSSLEYDGNVGTNNRFGPFELFYGQTNFMYEADGSGGWVMPDSGKRVTMIRSDYIPVFIPGMIGATMQTKDQNGNYNGYYDFANDGRLWAAAGILYLGAEHMDQNADIFIMLDNGNKLVYSNGVLQPSTTADITGFNVGMKDVRIVPDNSRVVFYIPGDVLVRDGGFTNATTVTIAFNKGLSKYPIGVYVADIAAMAQDPIGSWTSLDLYGGVVQFQAAAGQNIMIRFEYQPNPGILYNGGSGYGVGQTTTTAVTRSGQ